MERTRAADDFDTIRARLEELRRERERAEAGTGGTPERTAVMEPDAVAHVPPPAKIPVPSSTRRPGAI